MKPYLYGVFLSFLLVAGSLCSVYGASGKDIVRLKQGGISDDTIQVIIQEKVIETVAFTVDEILDMKNAELSEEMIRTVIRDGSFLKDAKPVIYGKDMRTLRFTTVKDLIELKNAGLSEETIQAIITYGTRDADDKEREKAWEMMKKMDLQIDVEGDE